MKDNQKDNKITNSQDNDSAIGYKPDQNNGKRTSQEPATDADDTKAQKEHQDTDHEHAYIPPTDGNPVVSEQTQNSNPGSTNNSDQGANQPS